MYDDRQLAPPVQRFVDRFMQPGEGNTVTISSAGSKPPRIWGEIYLPNPETGEWERHALESGGESYAAGRAALAIWSAAAPGPVTRENGLVVVDEIDAEFQDAPDRATKRA